MSYVELQVTTHFSFLRGASSCEELFAQAALLGYAALGVTDRNSLAGIVRAHQAAKEVGLRLVVGCRLDLEEEGLSVLVYPTDRAAYAGLCRLLSLGKKRAGKARCRLGWSDLVAHGTGLLAALVPEEPDAACAAGLRRLARGRTRRMAAGRPIWPISTSRRISRRRRNQGGHPLNSGLEAVQTNRATSAPVQIAGATSFNTSTMARRCRRGASNPSSLQAMPEGGRIRGLLAAGKWSRLVRLDDVAIWIRSQRWGRIRRIGQLRGNRTRELLVRIDGSGYDDVLFGRQVILVAPKGDAARSRDEELSRC